jgi:hypothetical protein
MDALAHGYSHTSEAVTPQRDQSHPLYALGVQLEPSDDDDDATTAHSHAHTPTSNRYILLVSKTSTPLVATLADAPNALATVLEGSGVEPGFQPPRSRRVGADGSLSLGPFAVAIVRL